MNESISKPKRIRNRVWTGYVCACGGFKTGQAVVCTPCKLAAKRPPVDPVTYYDDEQGRPYRCVPCTMKQYTLVSADRYDEAMSHLLVANYDPTVRSYYVATKIKGKRIGLHRLLTNAPDDVLVDHRNHDTLDNRDWNLRVLDDSQSACSRRLRSDNKYGYKGVRPREDRNNQWEGMVTLKGKHYFTKLCNTAREAAIEYNKLALRLHGEYAVLNVIPDDNP